MAFFSFFHLWIPETSGHQTFNIGPTPLYLADSGEPERKIGSRTNRAQKDPQDIRARGLKAQVSSCDDFDFEELPNQKLAPWV